MNPVTGEITPIDLTQYGADPVQPALVRRPLKPGDRLPNGDVVVTERVAMLIEDAHRYRAHREKRRRRRKIARATRRAQR